MHAYKTEPLGSLPPYSPTVGDRRTTVWHRLPLILISSIVLLCWYNYKASYEDYRTALPVNGIPQSTLHHSPRLVKARNGAVAAENRRCSLIGVDVLKEGGTAVDAAISSTLCTGVVNMFSSGIGGGGFMLVRLPLKSKNSSEAWTIDFRETAPRLANATMFVADPQLARYGGLAVGVPGELRGLEEAHRRWGKLPWKRLVQPSIELADGWEVDAELGRRIPWFKDLMLNNPDWSAVFAPNGVFLKEGEMIRRRNLAQTLRIIADHGADAFYKGPIAEAIVNKANSTGGILSLADLENYSVKVQRAIEGSYNGRRIMTTDAPTSGPVLLHMLNLLEHFDLTFRDGLNTHRMIEALKFGFAARTRISDPDFYTSDKMGKIATKSFAAEIIANVTDDETHLPDYYQPEYDVKHDHGTSHTSVVDSDGMAVAITSTVNLIFGSQVLDPVTGVILNDEMDDFSTPGVPNAFGLWPSPYNYPQAGKRPLSSIAPTVIENPDGTLHLVIGGAGGSRIFSAILQVILNLDWGLDVSQAIEYGRLHNQLYPLMTDADNNYPPVLLRDLRARGHNITVADIHRVAAVVQGITREGAYLYAASDSRKNGFAAGY